MKGDKMKSKRQMWMHEYAAVVLSRYDVLAGNIDWFKADQPYHEGYTPRGALVGLTPNDIRSQPKIVNTINKIFGS